MHIAPGCGTEDFELSKVEDLPVLTPVDESGRFSADYGWLAGRGAHDVADDVIDDLRERGLLVDARPRSPTAIPSAGAATRR